MEIMNLEFDDYTYDVAVRQDDAGKVFVEFRDDFPGANSYEENDKIGFRLVLEKFNSGKTARLSVVEKIKGENLKDLTSAMDAERTSGNDVSLKDLPEASVEGIEKFIVDECRRQMGFQDLTKQNVSNKRQNMKIQTKGDKMKPTVFISYSHDSSKHKADVKKLCDRLKKDGINVVADCYLPKGSNINRFMTGDLPKADKYIIICTEAYVDKVDSGIGGAAFEDTIITSERMANLDKANVFPVILNNPSKKVPVGIKMLIWTDLDEDYESEYQSLLESIRGKDAGKSILNEEFFVKKSKRKIPRNFDDMQRKKFVNDSFKTIRDEFERQVIDLNNEDGVEGLIEDHTGSTFICSISVNGKLTEISISKDSGRRPDCGSIYYSDDNIASSWFGSGKTFNGNFNIENDEYELYFNDGGFGSLSDITLPNGKLTANDLANHLWKHFMNRAGIK